MQNIHTSRSGSPQPAVTANAKEYKFETKAIHGMLTLEVDYTL
jgi:hypothetical protein